MSITIARVAQIFIYPVKSMAGVPVQQAHVGVNGLLGDRRYSFVRADQSASNSFPWLTARQSASLLLYKPRFQQPPTPEEAEPAVQVQTPGGTVRKVDDPMLREELADALQQPLFLLHSGRGVFDSQHLSVFSLATLRALAEESGSSIDPRQFRANLYIEPVSQQPFEEERWAGGILRIGAEVLAAVTQRDHRCMVINLDPDSTTQDPRVLRTVARQHDGHSGVYANVIRPGPVKVGDAIEQLPNP